MNIEFKEELTSTAASCNEKSNETWWDETEQPCK
jgi:hypothetical protein